MIAGFATLGPDRMLRLGTRQVPVAIGRAGVTDHKVEGDAATPSGQMKLRKVMFRADRLASPPRCRVPREPIAPHDGWCDDPFSTDYNLQIVLPHESRHERLWREDGLYDVIAVLGWNDSPVEKRRGSAIFLHVARRDMAPTEGCLAVSLPDLLSLLADGLIGVDTAAAGA